MQDDHGDREAERSEAIAKDQVVENVKKNYEEDCCVESMEEALGFREELPDVWATAKTSCEGHGKKCIRGVIKTGEGRGWDEEVQESIQNKILSKNRWDKQRDEGWDDGWGDGRGGHGGWGGAVGPGDVPVVVWVWQGKSALELLTKLHNRKFESDRMPEECGDSVLVPLFQEQSRFTDMWYSRRHTIDQRHEAVGGS